jgi:Tol biopolymer transport system component
LWPEDDDDELRQGLAGWAVRTDPAAAFGSVARRRSRLRLVRRAQTVALVLAGTAGGILALSRAFAGRPEPAGPPARVPEGLIAFERAVSRAGTTDENTEIFTVDPTTGRLRRLTSYPGLDGQPAWSPDGARVAFARGTYVPISHGGEALHQGIFVMDADGSHVRRLTNCPGLSCDTADSSPAWSPDGGRIAFVRTTSIWVVGSDGSSPRRLCGRCARGHLVQEVSWSPDGRTIAFSVADDSTFTRMPLLALDVATGEVRPITGPLCPPGCDTPRVIDHNPAWSPDGRRVAFSRVADVTGRSVPHVMTVRPDGSDLRDLFGCPGPPSAACPSGSVPVWSPDGTTIAFILARSTPRAIRSAVYLMDADGRNVRVVPGTQGVACCLSWQPGISPTTPGRPRSPAASPPR